MACHQFQIVGDKQVLCRKAIRSGRVSCAKIMLTVACSISEELATLEIGGVYPRAGVVA